MKKQIVSVLVGLSVLLAGCASSRPATAVSSNSALSSDTDAPDSGDALNSSSALSAASVVSFKVDWDKCSAATKAAIMGGSYSYVKDLYFKVDDSNKKITMTAALDDATKPSVALDYADTMLRQFNFYASQQDSSISGGTKTSRGGLYDVYQVQIGIAPSSKTSDSSQWFIFDTVPALSQTSHEIKLQAAYR